MPEYSELDRMDDIVLVMLYKERDSRKASNGMYRGNLFKALNKLAMNYFEFPNDLHEYPEFMDTLEMFDTMDMFSRYKKGSRIALSDKGEKVAKKLDEELSQEQDNAVVTAIAEA